MSPKCRSAVVASWGRVGVFREPLGGALSPWESSWELLGGLLGAVWGCFGDLRSALGRVSDKRTKRATFYKTAGNHHVAQVPPILGGRLGAVWVCFGSLWGALGLWEHAWGLLGNLLGASWACWGFLGAVLGRLGTASESSWSHLGAVLSPILRPYWLSLSISTSFDTRCYQI